MIDAMASDRLPAAEVWAIVANVQEDLHELSMPQ